jgi:Toxin with endonuclease activity, of toxin-antitoxin system
VELHSQAKVTFRIVSYLILIPKRAYDSNTDAYLVFKKMLDRGRPPDDWDELVAAVKGEVERLEACASSSDDRFNLDIS